MSGEFLPGVIRCKDPGNSRGEYQRLPSWARSFGRRLCGDARGVAGRERGVVGGVFVDEAPRPKLDRQHGPLQHVKIVAAGLVFIGVFLVTKKYVPSET